MEQEYTPNEQSKTGKIYINKAIYVATYLGGPLVAGYLISSNFKVFNEPGKAKKDMDICNYRNNSNLWWRFFYSQYR
ncbi:MAG TPA: hypothetical protein VFX43_02405 [Chitinophagaceae bacterium]|nr:hypothetical protein [Chitinophagaceae bacterium]